MLEGLPALRGKLMKCHQHHWQPKLRQMRRFLINRLIDGEIDLCLKMFGYPAQKIAQKIVG